KLLEVKNVSKNYVIKKRSKIFSSVKIKKNAVKNVSINIPEGKIIGILGENGAGKTTIIKMMTTLVLPDSGQILLDGNDINDD
ncbi:ATP-binding cassette domain-containing protein, partial [Streptococcus pyogenes]